VDENLIILQVGFVRLSSV